MLQSQVRSGAQLGRPGLFLRSKGFEVRVEPSTKGWKLHDRKMRTQLGKKENLKRGAPGFSKPIINLNYEIMNSVFLCN